MKHRLVAALPGVCGLLVSSCGSPTTPTVELPAVPQLLSPADGTQLTTDTPTFSVQNAKGFDAGQATYTFHIRSEDGSKELVALAVPAGSRATSAAAPSPLPRGHVLSWSVTAKNATAEVASGVARFRTNAVPCLSGRDPYAKSIVDWFVPACSLAENLYNDPSAVLGPPDLGGYAPDHYHGFMSLGEKGYVTVDMEGCALDEAGPDVRVFQSVGREPVTLYASGSPAGPWELLEYRKPCGNVLPGVASHYCDFDLAAAGLTEARYFKIEDGEQYPCEQATTPTEGADIDAIQILHQKP